MENWSLTLHGRDGILRRLELGETEIVLGSGEAADILRVEGAGVATRHTRVRITRQGLQIEDLAGGTIVNGGAITGRIHTGYPASVRVGDATLVVEFSDTQSSTVAFQAPETVAGIRNWEPPAPTEAHLTGKYNLIREIARGGMGLIYSGDDPQLKRQVAVKISRVAQGGRDLRFVQEAEVLAHLAHPNIVPIYSIGTDADGQPFYAMKLIQGRTLQAVLKALSEGDAATVHEYPRAALLTIFRKVCDAMAFAHSKGILHRDLKPENIMVGEFGEVLVMDWGLAKPLGKDGQLLESRGTVSGDPGMTQEGEVMGTPQYMSPEQATGMVAGLDKRSDVYSLGGILYAILTLHPPIEGNTLDEVLNRVRKGDVRPMTSRQSEGRTVKMGRPLFETKVPEALQAVTLKAMARDRENRYPTVEAFAADIDSYQQGFATSALEVNAFGQLVLLMRRNKGVTVALGLAVLVLVTLSSWFVLSLQTKERAATRAAVAAEAEKNRAVLAENLAQTEKTKAVQAETIAQKEKNRALQAEKLAQTSSADARISLAEAAFRAGDFAAMNEALKLCPPEFRDQTWEYLAAKQDSSIGQLKIPGFDSLTDIQSVPGVAGQFAFATERGEIGFVEAASGALLRSVKTDKGLRCLSFSGDGRTFAAITGTRELSIHQTDTGEIQNRITLPSEIIDVRLNYSGEKSVALNQDGSQLAAILKNPARPTDMLLFLANTADGTARWQVELGKLDGIRFDQKGKRLVGISSGKARFFWIFNADTGKQIFETPLYSLCEALHPDGNLLAIGTRTGEVQIFNIEKAASLQTAKLHSGQIMSLAWSADGHLLTMGTEGKQGDSKWLFKLWAPKTLALRAVFSGLRPGTATRWSYDPLSGLLVTHEGTPRIWRIPAGREIARMTHRSETGYSGAFVSDTVLLARELWGLTLYDVSKPAEWLKAKNAPRWPDRYSTVHPPTGRIAVSDVTSPYTLQLFSADRATATKQWSAKIPAETRDLRFHPQGDTLAVTLANGSLLTFEVSSGKPGLELPGKFQQAVFAGPDRQLLASQPAKAGTVGNQLQLIHGKTGALLKTIPTRFDIQVLAVSADQTLLAAAGADSSIHFLDPKTLEEKPALRAHEGEISALAFHPSLPILGSASSDGSIKLWNYQTRRMLDHFIGLNGVPVALAFSPNGALLFAEAQETTMRLYDVSHLNSPAGSTGSK